MTECTFGRVRILRDECDWRAKWWPDWADDEVDVSDSCDQDPLYRYFFDERYHPCLKAIRRKDFECTTLQERREAQRRWQRC